MALMKRQVTGPTPTDDPADNSRLERPLLVSARLLRDQLRGSAERLAVVSNTLRSDQADGSEGRPDRDDLDSILDDADWSARQIKSIICAIEEKLTGGRLDQCDDRQPCSG